MSIDERPGIVARRSPIGDWKGDTIIERNHKSALLMLVERKTLYTVIARLLGKRADLLAETAIEEMKKLSASVRTITLDNGLEFAQHADIA